MLISLLFATSLAADTLLARPARAEPLVDGVIIAGEYPARAATIEMPHGAASIWIARANGYVFIAAAIPDTSFYWGDDWEAASTSTGKGWALELRIKESSVKTAGGLPRIAFSV